MHYFMHFIYYFPLINFYHKKIRVINKKTVYFPWKDHQITEQKHSVT